VNHVTGRATVIGRYALVGAAGALGGGLLVARLTDAMPRMMTAVMEAMHARMEAAGIDPAEM
jgi:hypothetical protein